MIGLTRSLAVELGQEDNRNCVCPGPINTGMTSAICEEDKRSLREDAALRRR